MEHSVRFYLEKRGQKVDNVPVIMWVLYGEDQKLTYYTGFRCNVSHWNKEKMQLRQNQTTKAGVTSSKFNDKLEDLRRYVKELFKKYDGSLPTLEKLRTDLNFVTEKTTIQAPEKNLYDYFQKFIDENRSVKDKLVINSERRQKTFECVIMRIKKNQPAATFQNFDLKSFAESLSDLSNNSQSLYLRSLHTFYKQMRKQKIITLNPFDNEDFAIKGTSYDAPYYITVEERDQLINATVSKPLEAVKDIFCFQCLVGCRIGDLLSFTRQNIQNNVLTYRPEKTESNSTKNITVPLSEKATSILSKYSDSERLFPQVSIVTIDKYLKLIFAEVGIIRPVLVTDKRTGKKQFKPLNELATSHMARKCFIGGMFQKSVQLDVIGSMSGHVKGSKAIARYYEVSDEQKIAAMKLIE